MHEAKKRITKHDIASVYEFGFTLKNPLSEQVALHRFNVITIRKEVTEGYVFTGVCDSVRRGGSGIPACIAGLQAHTQGGKLRGLDLGGVIQVHTQGKLRGMAWGFPAYTGGVSRPRPRHKRHKRDELFLHFYLTTCIISHVKVTFHIFDTERSTRY